MLYNRLCVWLVGRLEVGAIELLISPAVGRQSSAHSGACDSKVGCHLKDTGAAT